MKNDDFRGPFGRAPVMVLVIFIKFQGRGPGHDDSLVRSIWQGPCNGFGDFQGRPREATGEIGVTIVGPQDPLWGQGG